MKNTLIALAVLALTATAAQAHDVTTTGSANVSGAINNSVSAAAQVNGLAGGNSFSAAGSNASSTATAGIAAKDSTSYNGLFGSSLGATGYKQSADVSIVGSTDTKVSGYAYNTSVGGGSGSAASAGWSDAGSNATITSNLYNGKGTITLTGATDTGKPTNVAHGPDVGMTVGTNQGAAATGVAGGTYDAKGHVAIDQNYTTKGVVTGAVGDTKNATAYASTAQNVITGYTGQGINAQVLNAGSNSTVNASGSFTNSTTTVGNFTGVSAPIFTNSTSN